MSTIKSIYAFHSQSTSPCKDCIEVVKGWNYQYIDGSKFVCTSCDNTMYMSLIKENKFNVDELIGISIVKSLEDKTLYPHMMELSTTFYTKEDFKEICNKHNLGNNWEEVGTTDKAIIFKNNDHKDVIGELMYAPMKNAVLYLTASSI